MRLILLSDKFYSDYSGCPEILEKRNRPYVCALVRQGRYTFAVPFRHHIGHKHAFFTVGDAGLDYSKTVVISDVAYISDEDPTVDTREFRKINANMDRIQRELRQYIKLYKKATMYRSNPHYASILRYSALQYFEEYL